MKKFTFKTEKSTGRYRSFFSDFHYIKLNKVQVSSIDDKFPHKIRLQVIKADKNEYGNPNCEWKWITLKKESASVEEAKKYVNDNYIQIQQAFNFVKNQKQ